MRFGRSLYPTGTAIRMSADTMRHAHGAGIPSDTIVSWEKRGSNPSGPHLDLLAETYGLDFVAAVFTRVPGLALAAQQARTDAVAARLREEQAETDRLLQIARGGR